MNEPDFLYIGWCKRVKNGVTSDKVWTAFKAGNTYYAGWGARGKSIRFKKHNSRNSIEKVMRSKEKDYNEVDSFQLFTILPYYKEEVEKYLTFSIMANKVR